MTYCVAMLLEAGLVCLADSRTNAGVDHVAIFRKMTVWERPGDRVLVLMTAGNLSLGQAVVNRLNEAVREEPPAGLLTVPSMADAALLAGEAVRAVDRQHRAALRAHHTGFNVSLILAGQIADEPPRVFQVYAAGNFIEATPETPYFQIGETKYGKPILDRVLHAETDLMQAAKLGLISMDSTLRSNISVGLPLDLLIYPRDSLKVGLHRQITEDDAYFTDIRGRWSDGLRNIFSSLPDPAWKV
jgi:putative proteasome-type protease